MTSLSESVETSAEVTPVFDFPKDRRVVAEDIHVFVHRLHQAGCASGHVRTAVGDPKASQLGNANLWCWVDEKDMPVVVDTLMGEGTHAALTDVTERALDIDGVGKVYARALFGFANGQNFYECRVLLPMHRLYATSIAGVDSTPWP